MLLLEIRGKTIAYASHKRKEEKAKEQALNIEIGLLEQDVNEDNVEEFQTCNVGCSRQEGDKEKCGQFEEWNFLITFLV